MISTMCCGSSFDLLSGWRSVDVGEAQQEESASLRNEPLHAIGERAELRKPHMPSPSV
jgi:hypothetical protein